MDESADEMQEPSSICKNRTKPQDSPVDDASEYQIGSSHQGHFNGTTNIDDLDEPEEIEAPFSHDPRPFLANDERDDVSPPAQTEPPSLQQLMATTSFVYERAFSTKIRDLQQLISSPEHPNPDDSDAEAQSSVTIGGREHEVLSFLTSRDSSEALLKRSPWTHIYQNAVVEHIYLLWRHPRYIDLPLFMALAGCGVYLWVVFGLELTAKHGSAYYAHIVYSLYQILGCLWLLCINLRYAAKGSVTWDDAIWRARFYEYMAQVLYFFSCVIMGHAFAVTGACIDAQRPSISYCINDLYSMGMLNAVTPLLFMEMRSRIAMVGMGLGMAALLIGWTVAYSEISDYSFKVTVTLLFQLGFRSLAAGALWGMSTRHRSQFEAWVRLQRQSAELVYRRYELNRLMRVLLPENVVRKITTGAPVMEVADKCVISVCRIHDFNRWSLEFKPIDVLRVVDKIQVSFDAFLHKVPLLQRLRIVGDRYFVVGGLQLLQSDNRPPPRTRDVVESTVHLARWQIQHHKHEAPLSIGVHIGKCSAGIVGGDSLWFEVCGEAPSVASELCDGAGGGIIHASGTLVSELSSRLRQRFAVVDESRFAPISSVPQRLAFDPEKGLLSSPRHARRRSSTSTQESLSPINSPSNRRLMVNDTGAKKRLTLILQRALARSKAENTSVDASDLDLGMKEIRMDGKEIDNENPFDAAPSIESTNSPAQVLLVGLEEETTLKETELFDLATRRRAGHGSLLMATALLVVFFIPCAEGAITPLAAILALVNVASVATFYALVQLATWSIAGDHLFGMMVLSTTSYGLPVIWTSMCNGSVVAGRPPNIGVLVLIVSTFDLMNVMNWKWCCLQTLIVVIESVLISWFRDGKSGAALVYISLFAVVFTALQRYRQQMLADHRKAVGVNHSIAVACDREVRLHQGLLGFILPLPLVQIVEMKILGITSDAVIANRDVSVLLIRLDGLHSRLGLAMGKPNVAFSMLENVHTNIESALRTQIDIGPALLEKVYSIGDEVLIAGPVHSRSDLDSLAASRGLFTIKAAGAKDLLLLAIRAALHVAASIKRRDLITTMVLHTDVANSAVVGMNPPTFALVGPATRVADAVMAAAPPGHTYATSHLRRVVIGSSLEGRTQDQQELVGETRDGATIEEEDVKGKGVRCSGDGGTVSEDSGSSGSNGRRVSWAENIEGGSDNPRKERRKSSSRRKHSSRSSPLSSEKVTEYGTTGDDAHWQPLTHQWALRGAGLQTIYVLQFSGHH